MSLGASDRALIEKELGREPTRVEVVLFENLWSEHCAYRSSRILLQKFDSSGADVLVGPGDDAAVVRLDDEYAVVVGIESHNHPSFVDPYDGAATGVGGIVRDVLSMGAYPIALADCLYFGSFDDEHSRYLFEGVVEGIADYGNAIGVPTVTGSVTFHPGYEGNPLVNVGCVGLVRLDRVVRAVAQEPGNALVIVGNATGRDGLGGASFASEDLGADAETADRPAVQVGDPYAEKLLIEANEALLDAGVVVSARDLGAAGLGGATSEMVAKGGLGARIWLDRLHLREPGMDAVEILLAESQERMCYEVNPDDVGVVRAVAERYDLGCSVVGEVRRGNYECVFEEDVVVDVPAAFLSDGSPANDLGRKTGASPDARVIPDVALTEGFEAVVGSPNTACKRWVYRQYDHEVGVRTSVRPGADAAVVAVHEAELGVVVSAGAEPYWTALAPYAGAWAVGMENASNLAVMGARPVAAVDCLNGGNPENPRVYGGFAGMVEGLSAVCKALGVPVVGGNVSLYNDSPAGPIPSTPTVMMVGVMDGYDGPGMAFRGEGSVVLVGETSGSLGGSELLAQFGGADEFPDVMDSPRERIRGLVRVASAGSTLAVHDVSHGGLAVTLAEMVTGDTGVEGVLPAADRPIESLFCESPGRAVVETTDVAFVREVFEGVAPVTEIGRSIGDGRLVIDAGSAIEYSAAEVAALRGVIGRELG